ncbi:uncharacterized protein LOC126687423 [Mercurialis annua]|uniref:uncharacterized protein LOC126687423 n=1 Tax=Mercurialis annua TaxID=3986 RepID=UPI00215E0AA1|nr:uncharacterized protein LOC126687423 [Mercurialis annua]
MRIRKNANHSSLMFSPAASRTETHVCQLNQSPWDVIPFTLQTYQSYLLQYDGADDSFNGNGSLGDSIGGVESNSVASLMEDDKIKVDNIGMEDDNCENKRVFEGFKFKPKKAVKKTDGKQLRHFKNELKEEDSMWDYQLKTRTSNSNVTSCNAVNVNGNDSNGVKKPEKAPVGARRGRGKGVKKGQASSSSNPYEFYYYSGFGPLWGKRRGEGNSNKGKLTENTTSFLAPSPIEDHLDEFDFIDDDDDEDDSENGEFGKKRMRKPVKARSLKSLM